MVEFLRLLAKHYSFEALAMQCTEKYFRIDPARIAFVRFVLEACDGLAFFRTVDAATGLVCAAAPPGREGELDSVLAGLAGEMFVDFAPGG